MPRTSGMTSGCVAFEIPDQAGSHARVPTLAHRSVCWRLLGHILPHPKGMGVFGSSTTAKFPDDHPQLLLGRPSQTIDMVDLDILATAGSGGVQTQLLLCRFL
ncbi:hypothetical protein ABBQ32_009986 [Trebouxia sp. C0010 RCD-2024]